MANIFKLDHSGRSKPMSRYYCKNEDMELQRVLEQNYDLLASDQINPDDPRRWLLIKREMPVQDPNSGSDRWSIDFFFVDQGGTPTFVECKRFNDTRARREVVGQMLEYAANGQHYWSKDTIHDLAQETARKRKLNLEDALKEIRPDNDLNADAFLDLIVNNLREGQVRLIFFLEEAPNELKSIVDFLNKQMQFAEVLLVEAKQYLDGEVKIIVPSLFGYTEQARQTKKTITVTPATRRKWDETSFLNAVTSQIDESEAAILEDVYQRAKKGPFKIKWGTGSTTASFGLKYDAICPRTMITIRSDGYIYLNFHWFNGSKDAEEFRDDFKRETEAKLGFSIPNGYEGLLVPISIDVWGPKAEQP